MKTKIVNGEYVDFALLLEKCEFRDNNDKKRKALSVNNLGQVVWDEVKPKRFISSIHSWTSASLCYTSVYAGAHPHRAQELLKYAYTVRTAATRFGGIGVILTFNSEWDNNLNLKNLGL